MRSPRARVSAEEVYSSNTAVTMLKIRRRRNLIVAVGGAAIVDFYCVEGLIVSFDTKKLNLSSFSEKVADSPTAWQRHTRTGLYKQYFQREARFQ